MGYFSKLENKISHINDQYINRFIDLQKQYKYQQIQVYKNTNIKKFNKLQQQTFNEYNFHTSVNNNWLVNLTDVDIPNDVAWLLEVKDIKRSKVSHILNKRQFSNTIQNPVDVEIIKICRKTKRFCDQHKELFITMADKGNRTIIMLKSDYEQKMA